jgi:hypothetical protein
MSIAKHTKRGAKNRTKLEVYLTGSDFMTSFALLDGPRRLLALEAVAQAFERLVSPPAAPGASIVRWKDNAAMQERVRGRTASPSDKAIARELGLPVSVVKPARWRYAGPKRATPHITKRGPLQIAA